LPVVYRPRNFSLFAGPRLGVLFVRRGFSLRGYEQPQDYFNVSPGLVLGGGWAFQQHWQLELSTRIHYVLVSVDDKNVHAGYWDSFLGWAIYFEQKMRPNYPEKGQLR